MAENELRIYPWAMSATGKWSEDSGLNELRDYAAGTIPVEEMVEWLWPPGGFVQNVAVAELLAHGNVRQAAVFVRALVEEHPVCKASLKTTFGPLIDEFMTSSPDKYPSRPSEYPPHVQIVYVH